jgi:hypothetical protein
LLPQALGFSLRSLFWLPLFLFLFLLLAITLSFLLECLFVHRFVRNAINRSG